MLWFFNANLRQFTANLRLSDRKNWRNLVTIRKEWRFYRTDLRPFSLMLANWIKKLA